MLQQTLLGFLNMPESADHCSVPTLRWGRTSVPPEKLRFSPSLQLLNQGFLFLECSPHGPLYGNSFLFRSHLTISGSEESSKPSQSPSLAYFLPYLCFGPFVKPLLHSEIYLLLVYLFINYFFPLEWKSQEGKYLVSYTLCTPVPRKVSVYNSYINRLKSIHIW